MVADFKVYLPIVTSMTWFRHIPMNDKYTCMQNSKSAHQFISVGVKTRKVTHGVNKDNWHRLISVNLGKATLSVLTMDVISKHLELTDGELIHRWIFTTRCEFPANWPFGEPGTQSSEHSPEWTVNVVNLKKHTPRWLHAISGKMAAPSSLVAGAGPKGVAWVMTPPTPHRGAWGTTGLPGAPQT